MSNKYCIVDSTLADGLTQEQMDLCAPKTMEFRKNLAGNKAIIEYVVGSKPSFLTGITAYTQSQIWDICRDPVNGWEEEEM